MLSARMHSYSMMMKTSAGRMASNVVDGSVPTHGMIGIITSEMKNRVGIKLSLFIVCPDYSTFLINKSWWC